MKRSAKFLAISINLLLFSGNSPVFAQQLLNSAVPVISAKQPNTTVTEIISLSSERPILRELIIQSGILSTLAGNKSYTFFAPTEEALKELQYESADKLQTIMQHHIVSGRYTLSNLKDGAVLTTLAGDSLTVIRKFKAASINSIHINSSQEASSNVVMHTISDTLKPKKLE